MSLKATSGLLRKTVSGSMAAAIAACAAAACLTGLLYVEAIRSAESAGQNYATLLSNALEASLRTADANLAELQREFPRAALDKKAVPIHAPLWNREFDARLAAFPELHGLRIFDADGDLLYTNDAGRVARTNIADREHFRQAKESSGHTPIFSEVLVARTTQQRIFVVARPLRDAQGAFRGIATASIEFDHFLRIFGAVNLGEGESIAVYRLGSFTPLVRSPKTSRDFDRALPPASPTRTALERGDRSVTARATSIFDGVARIYSSRRLERYPLFVSVGISERQALKGWYSRTLPVALTSIVLAMFLIFLLLRLSRAEKALADLAMRDPLTALLNRGYVDEALPQAIATAERSSRALSVVLLDIDHFKRVNDTYGHEVGDRVIKEIGGLLGAGVRRGDIASRYGGEEFLLVLPGTPSAEAARRVDDLRRAIARIEIPVGAADPLRVTASAGVAAYPEHAAGADQAIAKADRALYAAKAAGRDCVKIAQAEIAPGRPARRAEMAALP